MVCMAPSQIISQSSSNSALALESAVSREAGLSYRAYTNSPSRVWAITQNRPLTSGIPEKLNIRKCFSQKPISRLCGERGVEHGLGNGYFLDGHSTHLPPLVVVVGVEYRTINTHEFRVYFGKEYNGR